MAADEVEVISYDDGSVAIKGTDPDGEPVIIELNTLDAVRDVRDFLSMHIAEQYPRYKNAR